MSAENETDGKVAAMLAAAGVGYAATFVPQSMSRNCAEKDRTLNWRVAFARTAPRAESFTTDFMQGIGHVPHWKQPRTLYDESACGKPWETGVYAPYREKTRDYQAFATRKLPAPSAASVIYCLLADVSAYGVPFEEWAQDNGYDTDSRKAESTYQACVEIGRNMRRVFGLQLIEQLRDALQDY